MRGQESIQIGMTVCDIYGVAGTSRRNDMHLRHSQEAYKRHEHKECYKDGYGTERKQSQEVLSRVV